jgi:photosystem II stability/assembly factor-like uncharacterized protein
MKKFTITLAAVIIALSFIFQAQAQKQRRPGAPSGAQSAPASWQELYSGRDPVNMWCMYFKDANNGWVGGQGRIVHTSDGGKTWEKQYEGQGRINAICFKNDKDGFAAGESNLYMYTHDGGATWKEVYTVFQGASFTKIFFTDATHGYMLSTSTVYRTTDGGANWKDVGPKKPAEYSTRDYTGLAFTDTKHGILVGDYEMMFTTDDGGTTWKANTKDYFSGPRRNLYSIGFINATTGWISCSKGSEEDLDIDCLYTEDGGVTWTKKKCFNLYQIHNFTFHGNCGTAISPMNQKTVYVTTDGGATWTEQTVVEGRDKVFAAEMFSATVGYAVVIDRENNLFHCYVPKP